jgi:hypothetical protein
MLYDKNQFKAVGQQTLAVAATAVGLTVAGSNVTDAIILVNDAEVRFLVDGNTATAASGRTGRVDEEFHLTEEVEIENFSVIRKGSVSAEIDIIYLARTP